MTDPCRKIIMTTHAIEQAMFRCGMTEAELRAAVCLLEGYRPESRGEIWIPVKGGKGIGTAVVKARKDAYIVVTVRDSNSFTQGERTEPLKASLYEQMRRKK